MSRINRRSFLTALGIGSAGAAVAVIAGPGTPSQPQTPPAAAAGRKSKGYQPSAHVQRYYRTTRV